jgi:hypothetical protein
MHGIAVERTVFPGLQDAPAHKMHWPIKRTMIFSLGILEKNDDKCILILVIY